jgi:hypothetical protein
MDGRDALREAITSVPIPGAPPRFSRSEAATGLAYLDATLRLDHVRRLTERLTVVTHRSAHRTTEVDVNLAALDVGPRAREGTVWVPVSRISGRSVAPVDVRDGSGNRLPLLTQRELGSRLASGLYRLLHGILASHPDARGDSLLDELLTQAHEARWLVQHALVSLLTEAHRPEPGGHVEAGGGTVSGQGGRYRRLALKILDEYADLLADWFMLLEVALNDHLLVVPLDASRDEHLIRYEMPLYAHEPVRGPLRGLVRRLRTGADGYCLSYSARISSSVRSYQLVLETEPGVHIERMFVSTDADRHLVDELHADLGVLAEHLADRDPADRAEQKILELQTQTTLRRLADLVRRREWDADHAGVECASTLPECEVLARVAVSGEAVETDEHGVDNSVLRHPRLDPGRLRRAAQELRLGEAHRDLSIERDPESHRAHAYWRGPGTDTGRGTQVALYAAALLTDTTVAGPRAVRLYGVFVAMIGYLAACFLAGSPWPFSPAGVAAFGRIRDPDAVIAVLLLVPGFLYTRLSLPARNSVAGRLQALSRLVANLCIVVVAVAAAAVAAGTSGAAIAVGLGATIAVPLFGTLALFLHRPAAGDTGELVRLGAPRWLDVTAPAPVAVDAHYSSVGGST